MSTPARSAQISRLDSRGAERIGGADQRLLAFAPEQVRELADGGRLAGAVDADNQRHLRVRSDRDRFVDRREDALDLLLHQIAQAGAVTRLRLYGGDDPFGRRDADVGRDQQLLECIDGVDVDRAGAFLRRVSRPHDLVEAFDDLLLGAGEAVLDAAEKSHSGDLIRSPPPPAAAAASAP